MAKICFLEVIIKRIYRLLEQPKLQLPERAIGDLLEAIVVENFKNNSIEKFDQICKVDSIWNMNYVKEIDKNKVKTNNIFIIQESEDAKYLDFGFLLKGEILILVQCKKSLTKEPNDYITIKKIITQKTELFKSFQDHFECEIKKIKLFYLTGIYFTDKINNKYKAWSGKEQSFKILEKITTENNIPLVFYDVQDKNLLIKNDSIFEICSITGYNSLICNEKNYSFVEIKPKQEELTEILEGIKSQSEIQQVNLINKFILENKSENKIDNNIYENYLNRQIIPNKRVVVEKPDAFFLINNNKDILTTFKIKGKKFFSYYDTDGKKMKYGEIRNGEAKEIDISDIKIYFLKKKTERVDKTKESK